MKVGIIGCGAAGMIAALSASYQGHLVTILEKNSTPGKKLLSTGNGKCNYTNEDISVEYYNDNAKILFESVYKICNKEDTIKLLKDIGVEPYNKRGYIYPRSEQASSVVNCLIGGLKRNGVNVIYNCDIKDIRHTDKFYVSTEDSEYIFDKLIIAAGSNAAPKTGSDGSGYGLAIKLGHKIKKPLPALCGLKCKGIDFKSVSGVRCRATVTLVCDGQEIRSDIGELQLTDYGLSGIPIFQISGKALRLLDDGHNVSVRVDYASEYKYDDLLEEFDFSRAYLEKDGALQTFLEGFINSKLANMFYKEANYDLKNNTSLEAKRNNIKKIVDLVKNSEYEVTGHRGFDNCQVCTGGIYTEDIDETLESKICKDLYFAGEIIDVNGDCGGYNLQWAWSSGYLAGLVGLTKKRN